jgi:hypothetical protein
MTPQQQIISATASRVNCCRIATRDPHHSKRANSTSALHDVRTSADFL